jgi:hypothetical protein
MALTLPGNDQNAAAAPAMPPIPPTAQANPANNMNNNNSNSNSAAAPRSFSSFRQAALANNLSPLSRTPADEAMQRISEAMKQLIEETKSTSGNRYDIELVELNSSEQRRLNISVIVPVIRHRDDTSGIVAYHAMLVGDSIGDIMPLQVNIGNAQLRIDRVPGDAYDEIMRTEVFNAVKSRFPNARDYISADAEVIPRNFNVKEDSQLRSLVSNALQAAATLLNSSSQGFRDISIQGELAGVATSINVKFGQDMRTGLDGEPIRSDIVLLLSEIIKNNGQVQNLTSESNMERSAPLIETSGFMDLDYNPANANQTNQYTPQQPQMQNVSKALYSPHFIITDIDSPLISTLPGTLLALATTTVLWEKVQWPYAFLPQNDRTAVNGLGLHDIGAIGAEALQTPENPLGVRIDTKSSNFNNSDFIQLMSAFVRPDLRISIDVPEAGPKTWQQWILAAAAKGGEDGVRANREIFEAANLLTNGRFSANYAQGAPSIVDNQNRIQLGYYTTPAGIRRDLRDIDYLAVLGGPGASDPNVMQAWSNSFLRTDVAPVQRLNDRMRIIRSLTAESAVLTGYAHRVTFVAEWLIAFSKSVVEAGLVMRASSNHMDSDMRQRAQLDMSANTGLHGAPTGLFTASFPGTGGVARGGMGRWS